MQILAAAEEIFLQKGFKNTKVSDIAEKANANIALVNYYFRSKENLFNKVLQNKISTMATVFKRIVNENISFQENLKNIMEAHFDFLFANEHLPHFIVSEVISKKEHVKIFYQNFIAELGSFLSQMNCLLQKEIQQGRVRNIPIFDIFFTAFSLNMFTFVIKPLVNHLQIMNIPFQFSDVYNRRKTEYFKIHRNVSYKLTRIMKKLTLFCCFISFAAVGFAQLTLDECYKKARENYPLIKQFDLIEKSKAFTIATVNKNWLPQVSLSGRASWQSSVTALPDEFLNMLEQMQISGVAFPNKDQYNATLNLTQTLWDGGATSAQKKLTNSQTEVNKGQTEVNLYALNYQVNQLFFSVLLLKEQSRQNRLLIEELERNHKLVEEYIANGIAQRSDLDNIRVSILNAEQNHIAMQSQIKSCLTLLSAFVGEEISETSDLQLPAIELSISTTSLRPEILLFEAQTKQFETQSKLLYTKGMPRIGLFATGAYANPGLNMFKAGFTPYFIGGINLQWNFAGLYNLGNDKKNIEIQKKTVEVQKEAFLFNTNLNITKQNSEIEKLQLLLKQDDEIISLRQNIKQASAVKVENGTTSVNDYIGEVTLEALAKQGKAVHEIQLLQAVSLLNIEIGR